MVGLSIAAASLATIRRHAEESRPEECCGILLGEADPGGADPGGARVTEALPAGNAATGDRRTSYAIDPGDLVAAVRRARTLGLEIVGYYHSHPRGPARPSERDGEHAWPEARYLIVGSDEDGGPRCWRLRAGSKEFEEEPLEIVGER